MMYLRISFLLGIALILYGCNLGAQEATVDGIVLSTKLQPALGGGYKQKVIYEFEFAGSELTDSVVNNRSLPYSNEGDSILIRVFFKDEVVVASEMIGKKESPNPNAKMMIKLNSSSPEKRSIDGIINTSGDSIFLMYGTQVNSPLTKDNYLYDLLIQKPKLIGYEEKLINFFTEDSIFLETKIDNSNELYFSFIVTKEGKIQEIDILSKNNSEKVLAKLQEKIDSMPKWVPGYKDGKVVNTILFFNLYY